MHEISDGQAELICTSPPYWGIQSEADLLQPRKNQQDYQRVMKDSNNMLNPETDL